MKIKRTFAIISILLFGCAAFSTALFAKPAKGEHRKPPKEAIEACVDRSEGDSVEFTTRHGHKRSGVCTVMKEMLIALPEDHLERMREHKQSEN